MLLTRLEIDVMQANELGDAIELAHVHKMQAVVVHQDLVNDAILQRVRRQACCKIIVPVNWPKGDKYGVRKLHNMPVAALAQDGFEVMLCPRSPVDQVAEMREITQFIRSTLNPLAEVRFVVGALTYDCKTMLDICEAMRDVPAPNFIRTDINLRVQQAKANSTAHAETLAAIKTAITRPIKLSGNVGAVKTLVTCKADRYAVSLKQAQAIVKEINENSEKTQRLLATR